MAKTQNQKKTSKGKKKPVKKIASQKVHWLAEGYASMTPFLTFKDAAKALQFYVKAFGFVIKQFIPGPNNTITHAEMMYEGSTFMMGGESQEQAMFAPSHYKGTSSILYVYTPDVDALCKRAKKAGAVCSLEPKDMYWGDRVCILKDPEGYVWWFATHVKEVAPEDMHP